MLVNVNRFKTYDMYRFSGQLDTLGAFCVAVKTVFGRLIGTAKVNNRVNNTKMTSSSRGVMASGAAINREKEDGENE